MTHRSENACRLSIEVETVSERDASIQALHGFNDVCLVVLPFPESSESSSRLKNVGAWFAQMASSLGPQATLITIGSTLDLVEVHTTVAPFATYQVWLAIKRQMPESRDNRSLPEYHFGALVHTRYRSSLRHTKTRIAYTYCPICDKTTKDYGGKKHTYHGYGTLISDVWRDIKADPKGDLTAVIERFADLFGLEPYSQLRVLDCRSLQWERKSISPTKRIPQVAINGELSLTGPGELWQGDSLEYLRQIPDNAVDFVFTDPPYNLKKQYTGYTDDLEISQYFEWCDQWITELARILRPGRTCAILNIPLWAIRHFIFMEKLMHYQNWIAWDALSFPVRQIMPAHYGIVCFSKGPSRPLPGLVGKAGQTDVETAKDSFRSLAPLQEGLCLRADCIRKRALMKIEDRGPLTDLWWDIHRLKHNSRRIDHPTQLPPELLYRLISLFTAPDEIVLDCFNGSGTTTLAAHQLGRRFLGIELSEEYFETARFRHMEIAEGLNPFRKRQNDRAFKSKNSPVRRVEKRRYEVPKKVLQLEVKRIAETLGRLPTREEVIQLGKYPIIYYDEYFISWGEVCAAARTTGMTENRPDRPEIQPRLF